MAVAMGSTYAVVEVDMFHNLSIDLKMLYVEYRIYIFYYIIFIKKVSRLPNNYLSPLMTSS